MSPEEELWVSASRIVIINLTWTKCIEGRTGGDRSLFILVKWKQNEAVRLSEYKINLFLKVYIVCDIALVSPTAPPMHSPLLPLFTYALRSVHRQETPPYMYSHKKATWRINLISPLLCLSFFPSLFRFFFLTHETCWQVDGEGKPFFSKRPFFSWQGFHWMWADKTCWAGIFTREAAGRGTGKKI